jgi:hypothetical protein
MASPESYDLYFHESYQQIKSNSLQSGKPFSQCLNSEKSHEKLQNIDLLAIFEYLMEKAKNVKEFVIS